MSALPWNCENRELLAAAYGEWHISRQDDRGLILVWSPQNPTCPERTIRCHCGVVSMSWCGRANLLAAGLYDGRVRVYDLCKSAEAPLFESGGYSNGRHAGPVWGLEWVGGG